MWMWKDLEIRKKPGSLHLDGPIPGKPFGLEVVRDSFCRSVLNLTRFEFW
jgi:hypothetical protein